MTSLFRLDFLREQARSSQIYFNTIKGNIDGAKTAVENLRQIQTQWHEAGDEIDPQDLSTVDAYFVTLKPLAEALLTKICEGVQNEETEATE